MEEMSEGGSLWIAQRNVHISTSGIVFPGQQLEVPG